MDKQVVTPNDLVSSIGYDQHEIISNIMKLYCDGKIDCDPTYSKGVFYKHLPRPELTFDIEPKDDLTVEASADNLPIKSESLGSIMFDPPFVGGSRKDGKPGIIKTRFSYFKNIPELWAFYENAMQEFYRVLKKDGVLVFKCQDTVECGKNYFSHVEIMNKALKIGFYPKDLFILLAKNRMPQHNLKQQQHARKFHSYFWVFVKTKCKIEYV